MTGLLAGFAWVGHACFWTFLLNFAYAQPLSKRILRPFRLLCGVAIVGFPALVWLRADPSLWPYLGVCLALGVAVFPALTLYRLLRRPPDALLRATSTTVDYWQRLGRAALGDGRWRWMPRLPFSDVFRVEFTTLTLRPSGLPPAWDGLTLLVLSDFHFHGTPSRQFFDALIDDILKEPTPDLVLLVGDFLDSDAHHGWIGEVVGRLTADLGRYAVLGNHDLDHDPRRIRGELEAAGYTVVGERPHRTEVRGVPVTVLGHEGPWFPPPTGVEALPAGDFKLCLSHTPDHFAWAQALGVNLMVAGHVHGGQIQLPVIGPIFVPSVYSRRYDGGVYERGPTTMVVGRGLSGKEPLRHGSRPQVIRLVLRARGAG